MLSTIAERVSTSIDGVGEGVESRLFGMVISVDYGIKYDEENNVVNKPDISFSLLVRTAPRTLQATITLDGSKYTREVPVVVQ